jgi:peptide/nickel transport system permease protein
MTNSHSLPPEGRAAFRQMEKHMLQEQRAIKLRRLLHNKLSLVGLTLVVIMMLIALFAPLIANHDPYAMKVIDRLDPPSAEYWFGTDSMGRDVFSRVVYGTQVSMFVGFCVSLIAGVLGMVIGLYSSTNKMLDNILMRVCDGLKAIPSMLFAICLMTVLGPNVRNVIISLAITSIPNMARIARSEALVVREQTYIEAMYSSGASPARVLWCHIAPNILSPVIVQMTFVFASSIIQEAALSFLGAGVPLSIASWGSILNDGKNSIYSSWWLVVFPGLFTMLSVLGFNLFGDGLRDLLDPTTV